MLAAMSRFSAILVVLLGFLFSASFASAKPYQPGPGMRGELLAAVNAEFARIRPCGGESGPYRYAVDHVAVEREWGCMAGKARYRGPSGAFAVEFVAILRWKCDGCRVVSISFDPSNTSRQKLAGLRQVPPAILPRSIRWKR